MSNYKLKEEGKIEDFEHILESVTDFKILLNLDFLNPHDQSVLTRKVLHELYQRITGIEARLKKLERQ
jgi:hypothetical protein